MLIFSIYYLIDLYILFIYITFMYKEIYIDENYLVIFKEHGVYVINDRNMEHTPLIDILRKDYGSQIYVCHRLDAGTAGVMVFARNKKAHSYISKLFEENNVQKYYIAITLKPVFSQTLMLPIAKKNHGRYSINFKSGKKAVTSFYNASSNSKGALIVAKLFTGRTHQIRVHLKALKSPLYYDFLYNEKIDDKRLSLECFYLSFYDKFSNKLLIFKADISEFMNNLIKTLELSTEFVYQYVYESEK